MPDSVYECDELHLKLRPELDHPTTTYRMGYIDALKQSNPDLKLSYGYLGNQWTGTKHCDSRYHYIWCHSENVRNWYIRECINDKYDKYDGYNPSYWHIGMGYSFGHTDFENDSFIKAILGGSLMKWVKKMQTYHDEVYDRLQENKKRDWIDMLTGLDSKDVYLKELAEELAERKYNA